jgi:threonine synthase
VYDLDAAARTFDIRALATRPFGPARYAELMPPGTGTLALREGATPLIPLERLAARLGMTRLWLKDESRNPTWSFKDRAAAIAATTARQHAKRGLVVASTGNAAAATAAYAATTQLPAVVLVTPEIDDMMAAFVGSYSAHVITAPTRRDRWRFMRHCVGHFDVAPNSNCADPPVGNDPVALDGYKAIGFEIWDQLGHRAPAIVALPVGYGDALFAVGKAFHELSTITGSIRPRLLGGEVYGSLSQTLAHGDDTVRRVDVTHPTIAPSIGTPQSTYQALHAIRTSEGHVVHVDDRQVLAAQRLLLTTEGILVETASAAALAAVRGAIATNAVASDDEIVIVNTSSGLKSVNTQRRANPPFAGGLADFHRQMAEILAPI